MARFGLILAFSGLLGAGCGTARPRARVPFLADHYGPTTAPPSSRWHRPSAPSMPTVGAVEAVDTSSSTRRQVVTGPNGKRYALRWTKRSGSVGHPAGGSLKDGRALPDTGPGYRRIGSRPFGTDETVTYVAYAAWVVAQLFPGTAPVVIGDLSQDGGGHCSPHRSHRTGRDVDIGYYKVDNEPLRFFVSLESEDLDTDKTWAYVEALLRTGAVQYIFMDRAVQEALYRHAKKDGWDEETLGKVFQYPGGNDKAVVRHVSGHRNHFHVRFVCPPEDEDCES